MEDEQILEGVQDTPLTPDLYEHLQRRKQERLDTIETTNKIANFVLGWSLNSTGYLIARWLLLISGSTNLWIAMTLCFAISSTSSFATLSGLKANYSEGLELEGGEKLLTASCSLGMAGVNTFLSVKDFLHYQAISDSTVTQIEQDIRTLEEPNVWSTPFSLGAGILLMLVGAAMLFRRKP